MTLDEVVTEFEGLLAEARSYPGNAHGYPGKEVADSWFAREHSANLWARTLVERTALTRFEAIPWGPSVVSQFPSDNWKLRVLHVERLVGSLRNLRDELRLLGPTLDASGARVEARRWLHWPGWGPVGVVLGVGGIVATVIVGLKWGPF